ncbi:MAG: MFS transporter [Anaerolineae bacterium]|nr:MFS transporter [Anaerolineae bacterium]
MTRKLALIQLRNPAWQGALYYLLYWSAMALCSPYLNVYYSQLGFTGFQIGLLGALMPLMRLTAAPSASALADRRGWKKPILTLALIASGIFLFFLRIPQSFALILPIVGLMAVAQSIVTPIADGLVARMAVRYHVDYGKLRVWGSLGFAVSALATGALWQRLGYDAMFIVGALALVPVAFAAQGLQEDRIVHEESRLPLSYLFRDQGLIALFIANFLIGAGEGLYITFSGVYMDVLGGAKWMIGGLFGLSALVELPAMQYAGALTRRIGKPLTLVISYALMAAAFLGYSVSRTPLVLLFYAMLKGVGFGLYFPTTVSLSDERAPARWSSTVQSLLMALSWGLAPLLTTPLAGWLSDTLGLSQVFAVASGVQLLAILVLGWAILRRVFATTPLVEAPDNV